RLSYGDLRYCCVRARAKTNAADHAQSRTNDRDRKGQHPMGKESVQIRKHIEDERAKLDRNLAALEHRFKDTKEMLVRWSRTPGVWVGIAITAGLILAQLIDQRNRSSKPKRFVDRPCD